MTRKPPPTRLLLKLVVVLSAVALLAACSSDEDPVLEGTPPEETHSMESPDATASADAAGNACPVDGCKVSFASVEKAGGELKLTFSANYTADISRNHFHVFWDTFKPEQVSDNAERTHNVTQGSWEPTADNPYTTAGTVSTSVRGESTRVCVTPGDRDHNVIDPKIVECQDISQYL